MEDPIVELSKPPLGRSLLRAVFEYVGELVRVVVISLAIILPIRYFLVQPFYVKGASMEPNFYDHEYLIIDELSYRVRTPVRGEIVVFRYPNDPSQFFIKRVIGLPGEKVHIEEEKIQITNAEHPKSFLLTETYLPSSARTYGTYSATLTPDEYYLLGDNRTSSLDSRMFGPVRKELLTGRVWIRGWPLDRVMRFSTPAYDTGGQGGT